MSLNDLSINPSHASPFNIACISHLLTLPFYREPTSMTESQTRLPPRSQATQNGITLQVTDPTSDEAGAGAGPGFQGGKDAKRALKNAAGVVEARPGILEKANIAPLSNEEPEFGAPSTQTSTATSTLSGGAKIVFGTVTGNQDTLEQGRQEYYGEKH